ncbi:MAG: alpha/beta hydrolase family protein [Gemmatimonadaceae bacterium]
MSAPGLAIRLALLCVVASPAFAQRGGYDPLAVPRGATPAPVDLTVQDDSRSRAIPVRIFLPRDTTPAPVVMFSHGLGGSRTGSAYLGEHWSARGYVVVYIQHPGSDDDVWRSVDPAQRLAAMRSAASAQNVLLRLRDVPAVLNQLARWNVTPHSPLLGRLDLTRVGMSGHSFGAVTTQGVSGQRTGRGIVDFTDARIRAAVVMSPSTPRNAPAAQAFGGVRVPWLLMTGTKDLAPVGDIDLASRLGVFPALPPGSKYELVLDNAEHSAFTDTPLPGDREPRNPNHHRVILALSTAFWDAHLRNDAAARAWLDGTGPRSVLEPRDRWQRK